MPSAYLWPLRGCLSPQISPVLANGGSLRPLIRGVSFYKTSTSRVGGSVLLPPFSPQCFHPLSIFSHPRSPSYCSRSFSTHQVTLFWTTHALFAVDPASSFKQPLHRQPRTGFLSQNSSAIFNESSSSRSTKKQANMQLKTLIIAASLGLASAGTWGDEGSIATTPAAPVETPEKPVKGGEKPPVDDGDKPAPPAATTPAKGGDKPPAGGDKPGKPPGGKPTTPVAPTSSITVSYWGDEPVLETSKTTTTTDAEHTWEDVPSEETTTTSSAYYWGDESVIDTTTTTDPAHTWEDVPSEETTTTTSSEHYWGDVTTQPPAATTPVSGVSLNIHKSPSKLD